MSEFPHDEGEINMRDYETVHLQLNLGDLGPGNMGELGPSDAEAEALRDVTDERYWGPAAEYSRCMDDRLEGLGITLAGNRAVTEVAGSYMDRHTDAVPQSKAFARKISELNAMGRPPVFHEGCAALASQREALRYCTKYPEEVIEAAWPKLDALGATEFLTQEMLRTKIKTGGLRAEDDSLWDASAEELLEIARENGAEVETTPGDHKIAGNMDNMTPYGFHNGLFRNEHSADDGEPLGLLHVSWVGYRNQLLEDGYSEKDIAHILASAVLFNIGVQKLINTDGSPLATVEAAH